jgi:hypothetical protein
MGTLTNASGTVEVLGRSNGGVYLELESDTSSVTRNQARTVSDSGIIIDGGTDNSGYLVDGMDGSKGN